MRGRGRGRGRAARGRRGGITRGRGKKNVKVIESDEEEVVEPQEVLVENHQHQDENFPPVKIDLEADISQLQPPTFTTINRGPPEPMLRLRWDHRVLLIGVKVPDPLMHCCDKCHKPILIYGRMIPCKHVFCFECARKEHKVCPRCCEQVQKVEQSAVGTIYMCTHGGSRFGSTGCRRTYLSKRDLDAHIKHRHSIGGNASPNKANIPPPQGPPQPRKIPSAPTQNDPRAEGSTVQYRTQSRTNLITVPIQQDPPTPHYHQAPAVEPNAFMGAGAQYGGYNTGAAAGYYQQYPPPPPPPPPPYQETQYWPPMHQFYR